MDKHKHEFTVSDPEYNVLMTLSNLLQSEEVLEKYAADASEAGDEELAELFQSLRAQNKQYASQLRSKLCGMIEQDS